jgi:ankyrin repeat protein
MCDRAAVRLLAQHPDIARDNLFTAVVCGDVEYVRQVLDETPAAAATAGGSRGWTPLLYLCYARVSHPPTIANAVAIGRLLLDRGANPNDFYQAYDSRYTALVGVAGEGEQDSPRQPQGPALFDLLLDRGAEPFDIQVLYNTHFSGDVLWWLELVEAHTHRRRRAAWDDPAWPMLDMGGYGNGARFLLSLAIDKNDIALAEWLLAHGAGPNAPPARDLRLSKRSLYEDAILANRTEIATLLLRHGATPTQPAIADDEAFAIACRNGDRAAVTDHVRRHAAHLQSASGIFAAARADRGDIVALLLDLGVPIDIADSQQQRPLHIAAGHKAVDVARLLIQRGAAIDPRESRWNATPMGFAAHHDDVAMLDLLSLYSRDAWQLAFRGYVDRLRTVLGDDPALARDTETDGTTLLWWLPDDEGKAREVVALLLAHGADASARNEKGRTAADWARKRGMREVAQMLTDAEGRAQQAPSPPSIAAASSLADYQRLAEDWALAYTSGDAAAVERLNAHYGRSAAWEDVRAEVWSRVRTVREAKGAATAFGSREARDFVARDAGFGSWDAFAAAIAAGAPRGAFYTLDASGTRIRPNRTPTPAEWDALVAVMAERRIAAIDANGTMTDRALARIADLDHVTSVSLGGSRQLTDEGLRHLARMPQLEHLDLSEYPGGRITDRGLAVLRHLSRLRRFDMAWQSGVSDEGVANLRFCHELESVDLMGSPTGDAAIAALRGKSSLRRLKTGRLVTDAGIEHLCEIPLFTTPFAGDAPCSLMKAESGPQHLLIDGPFTGRGVKTLAALSGVASLSFFSHASELTPRDLAPLATMSNLQFFGCNGELCDDEAMHHLAAIPQLRMLLAQGTIATDAGFIALGRSRTLEYLWGRGCPNLHGRGFAALARMPSLRGLAVSCKQVDADALGELAKSPGLVELLPMEVSDDGFRHVGRCLGLESLWCMYCRETTDRATEAITALPRLRRYYAGASLITDRSLELLSGMETLERVEIYECPGVSDSGLAFLARLPKLREVAFAGLPQVTEQGLSIFPGHVHVEYLP